MFLCAIFVTCQVTCNPNNVVNLQSHRYTRADSKLRRIITNKRLLTIIAKMKVDKIVFLHASVLLQLNISMSLSR